MDIDGWLTPRPGPFSPENHPAPTAQETGWDSGPVWTGAENLVSNGVRTPEHLTRSEWLHRLRYSGPHANEN